MKKTLSNIVEQLDWLILGSICLFLPLFFYNLGNYSLVDFDEAWFAEVARNILVSRNPLVLNFNGLPFSEHPPLGFILIALSFLLFGINEFAARFFPALLGFASLTVLYYIGKHLFHRVVGIGASLMLVSCVWFIFRTRSANLDTIFLFLYLLSFLAIIKLKKNSNWIYVLAGSFAALLLTKTFIGITILPSIVILFYLEKIRIPRRKFFKALSFFILIILIWLTANYLRSGFNFIKQIFRVGLRPFGLVQPNFKDLPSSLTFQYLHYGIRKWYYPALLSLLLGVPLILSHRRLIPIYLIIVVLLSGFLTNSKTEIWHLIPLYPFLGLLLAFFAYHLVEQSFTVFRTFGIRLPKRLATLTIIPFIGLALWQIHQFRNEVRLFDRDISGLAFTAAAARNYPEKLYLYADYFLPSAVFYSQKRVYLVAGEVYPENTLVGIIDYGEKPFLLLGEEWKFKKDSIDPAKYELVSKHKEYILVKVE